MRRRKAAIGTGGGLLVAAELAARDLLAVGKTSKMAMLRVPPLYTRVRSWHLDSYSEPLSQCFYRLSGVEEAANKEDEPT